MNTVRGRASAKINLHLGVGGPRSDGFHELRTIYQSISLHDEITAAPAPGWRLVTRTHEYVDRAALPASGDDIVTRAAALLADRHGVDPHADVAVDKAIPIAGGLAGGSADAAAALVVLDRLWGLQTPHDGLMDLAARLGSDVPFALKGGTCLGTGRGEVVEEVPDPGNWSWVVVPSRAGLPTPAVYRHYDELFPGSGAPAPGDDLVRALETGDPRVLAATLHNDLQEPALDLRPDLATLIGRGESEGALRGLVSGSGPTCVFLCESLQQAEVVAEGIRGAGHETVLVATGPDAGAQLVSSSGTR